MKLFIEGVEQTRESVSVRFEDNERVECDIVCLDASRDDGMFFIVKRASDDKNFTLYLDDVMMDDDGRLTYDDVIVEG